jgi:hypothetical protein
MAIIIVILLIAAVVMFAIAAFGVSGVNRFNLIAAGLCLVAIALLLPHLGVG